MHVLNSARQWIRSTLCGTGLVMAWTFYYLDGEIYIFMSALMMGNSLFGVEYEHLVT